MLIRISALALGMRMLAAPHDRLLAHGAAVDARAERAADCATHGKRLLASGKLIAARADFQRALQLAPNVPNAPALRAHLQFINAELALTMRC